MLRKYLFLIKFIPSCLLLVACNQSTADDRHPDFPKNEEKCYPDEKECLDQTEDDSDNSDRTQKHAPKKLMMSSVEKFQGTVKNVERDKYPNGRIFIQIVLETPEGEKTILVGPANYVDQSTVKPQSGDHLIVEGYRIGVNGEEVILAKKISKNGNILQLLDDHRKPIWN